MALTPEQVRRVQFDPPQPDRRGYSEADVDAFLDLVEATLRGQADLTAAEVRDVAFTAPALFQRGYDEDQVDAFLDEVEQELRQRAEHDPGPGAAGTLTSGADLKAVRLPRAVDGTRGYPVSEVDPLIDRAAAALEGHGALASAEVDAVRFGPVSSSPGYHADAVDELLRAVGEELRRRES